MIPMTLSLPLTEARELPVDSAIMDETSFRCLHQRTARPLRAYLTRCCGDFALADDLLQEAYLRYLRSGFEGEDDNHRRNYLYRIATNLVRDHFRRARPESDDAMAELSLRDRQMLWLAYVEGSSHREIARALGLRAASIRSMLFRARHRLAEELKARGLRPIGEAP
jgi:RNA polymerase sigma-70 factor (ECF subfamily)